MQDPAVEAQEAAARELSKLLPSPESLSLISSIRSDYSSRQQANDAHLSALVTTQVDHARFGIEALTKAESAIEILSKNFDLIESLCLESEALIENHDQIQLLSVVRNNLNTTIKDVEGMLSISFEAEKARQLLSDPKELIKTYEHLNALEGKRRFALAAAASRPEEAGKLRDYFEDVSRTKDSFESTLWGYIKDFLRLSKDNPQTLVRALRIVEMQEILDEETRMDLNEEDESDKRAAKNFQGSGYKDKAYEQISLAVDDRFKHLFNTLVYEDMDAALAEASAIVNDVGDVYDYAAPCFPPRYELFRYVVQLYTKNFMIMLQKFGDRAEDISNTDILKLMGWLNTFEDQMIQLGVEESVATSPAESGALGPLIEEYVKRMSSTMQTWLANMLEIDKRPEHPPKRRPEDGRLYTPVAIDVFRLVGEQIQIVQEHSNGLMLFKAAQANIQVILDFQDLERVRLKDPVSEIGLDMLCAIVNNNVRCHELAVELAGSVVESLEPKYANQLDFADAVNGFLEVAKEAAQQTVELIFDDNGVIDLITKLYQKAWIEGHVTGSLIATFEDYFNDVKQYMEERSFRRFAEACLERTMVTYVEQLLNARPSVVPELISRMTEDAAALDTFFQSNISPKRLKERLVVILDIIELISGDSAEACTFAYSKLLSAHPDCPPLLVEKLMNMREGIPRKEAKEVIQECQDVYRTAMQAQGDVKGSESKGGIIFSKVQALKKKDSLFGL